MAAPAPIRAVIINAVARYLLTSVPSLGVMLDQHQPVPIVVLLWRLENRITLHVHPVGRLGRDMTGYAIFLEVSRHLLVGCVGLVKRPSPSITPQWVFWETVFVILDHDEPLYLRSGPMRVACRHLSVIRLHYFFHHHHAIGKLPIF